ncbi:hypothetical protein CICLE_v10013902mg [Citrus x clementina]|uniref:Uncharacterized protein n=1 Tax=Citrus clementina TaxID=85681 RepID=V4URY6_CITCL|nr:hypothetical protein CICLE_v10013902mg [Citrus x clementina]
MSCSWNYVVAEYVLNIRYKFIHDAMSFWHRERERERGGGWCGGTGAYYYSSTLPLLLWQSFFQSDTSFFIAHYV